MNANFEFYEKLIQDEEYLKNRLWNLVVITAINDRQKICYEKQIEAKLKGSKMPKQFKYRVIDDPCNVKIGAGGSTLHVIRKLYDEFSDDLYNMKILLVHAGGYSQRMPSCTVLGKVFYPIPCSSNLINDLLDAKLAIYTPFAIDMSPGILLTASDDIESFNLDELFNISKYFNSNNLDFVLIAHKSSLVIGKDHGCYGLGKKHENNNFEPTEIYECEIVLQKPSINEMRKFNIVRTDDSNEYVYSDSMFYFTHTVVRELFDYSNVYYSKLIEYNIELDAYKDFLQPLGTKQLDLNEYLKQSRANFNLNNPNHKSIFEDLYKIMSSKRSFVVALRDSNFYHLGTIGELFDLYLSKDENSTEFRRVICFDRNKNNQNAIQNDQIFMLNCKIMGKNIHVSNNCLLEYCQLQINEESRLNINENCYLNNCVYELVDAKLIINIPSNTCMHTIAIMEDSSIKYVTICFSRVDDLKKTYQNLSSILYMGKLFGDIKNVELTSSSFTLWNLKLFSSQDTMGKSFYECTKLIDSYLNNRLEQYLNNNQKFYSLFDLLRACDYDEMIRLRNN